MIALLCIVVGFVCGFCVAAFMYASLERRAAAPPITPASEPVVADGSSIILHDADGRVESVRAWHQPGAPSRVIRRHHGRGPATVYQQTDVQTTTTGVIYHYRMVA